MTTLIPPAPDLDATAIGGAMPGAAMQDDSGALVAQSRPTAGLQRTERAHGPFSDAVELVKARLVAMVLVTTTTGFLLAESGPIRWGVLLLTVMGTAMAAGSAMALNQAIERDLDARMLRTRSRPLPAGRMRSATALLVAALLGLGGTSLLLLLVDPLAATLAGANVLLYAFVYTPLKTRTTLNTVVGAVTGALPPMIGWAAASGSLDPTTQWGAWLLGAILFVWQLPHFLALAWMYREDYERGGFRMLPHIDRDGRLTAQVVLLSSLSLLPLGLMAVRGGLAGPLFAVGSLLLGSGLVALSIALLRQRSERAARRVFLASLVYLPLLLGLLALDHDWGHLTGYSAGDLAPGAGGRGASRAVVPAASAP